MTSPLPLFVFAVALAVWDLCRVLCAWSRAIAVRNLSRELQSPERVEY